MDVLMGFIAAFGFGFQPRGWAFCNGAILAVQTNSALFSLLGVTYGGNGQTTFGLPDLRGRMLIGQGNGPGLTPRVVGQIGGTEAVTLNITQMPAHNHAFSSGSFSQAGTAVATSGDATTPENNYLALSPKIGSGPNATQLKTYAAPVTPPATPPNPVKLAGGAITAQSNSVVGIAGNSQAHENMQPFLAINYCIASEGIYPSRN